MKTILKHVKDIIVELPLESGIIITIIMAVMIAYLIHLIEGVL